MRQKWGLDRLCTRCLRHKTFKSLAIVLGNNLLEPALLHTLLGVPSLFEENIVRMNDLSFHYPFGMPDIITPFKRKTRLVFFALLYARANLDTLIITADYDHIYIFRITCTGIVNLAIMFLLVERQSKTTQIKNKTPRRRNAKNGAIRTTLLILLLMLYQHIYRVKLYKIQLHFQFFVSFSNGEKRCIILERKVASRDITTEYIWTEFLIREDLFFLNFNFYFLHYEEANRKIN
eukprot:gene11311-7843_t